MTKYLVPLILILCIGCKQSDTPKQTYFGGKIVNPKCSYVTLSDNYGFNDTIYLKKDNSFIGSYKNFKGGLYFFGHGPEHQYVYLEPKDSLLFRLNTWVFDESLVFSGKNAERNNSLIEAFLQAEQEEKKIAKYYKLPQQEFLQKIDSIKALKLQIIEDYKARTNDTSEDFIDLLNIAVLYPIYTTLEQYASQNFNKKTPEKLVDSYFDYRSEVKSNKDSLIFYGPYYRYVIDKIYNDVYKKGAKDNAKNFTVEILNNINSEISSEEIKNKLLYNTVVRHFFKNPDNARKKETFFTFFKLNTSIEHKKTIQRLINDLKLLNPEDKLPSFDLVNAKGVTENITSIVKNRNAVILFKNYKYAPDDWVSSRINHLIKNNPDVAFVVINMCTSAKRYTKNIAIKHQYTLPQKSAICDFSSSKFPRMVLVNKKGIVKNGYTSLSSKDIDLQIKNLD